MSKASETVFYEYNASGLRVKKIATSTGTTHYTLHGKNIVHLTNGQNTLHFFYDAAGKPAMVEWNNGTTTAKYAYVQNLQGDIVGIIDSLGNEVVKYTYDAWGKPLFTTGPLAASLGKLNPFRYRSYVYDEETGLYYLRSRYYSPTWGRFINGDAVLTRNIFSYCDNNPENRKDENGHDWGDAAFDAEINNIYFMENVYPKIMHFLRKDLDYRYPDKNPKYDDEKIAFIPAVYNKKGQLLTQGVIDCSHLTFEVTGFGNTTAPNRYEEVPDEYKGELFVNGKLAVELHQGMEVYNKTLGHVGILILYDLGNGIEWCVNQSTSETITRSRVLFPNDKHKGPNITSFFTKDGSAPTWYYYTMPRYWENMPQKYFLND